MTGGNEFEAESNVAPHEAEAERLISRIVDSEATGSDWQAFCRMAEISPGLWRELAEMQHQHTDLFAHVMRTTECAEMVEAPVQEEMVYRFNERVRAAVVVGGWTGWAAAAAAIMVAWGVGLPGFGGGPSNISPRNGYGMNGEVIQAGTPGAGWADALQTYLDRGRESGQVVGELPQRILIDARPVPAPGSPCGGRYEVIYLRQIMERAVVDEVYGMGTDDAGRPAPVRMHVAPTADPDPM